MKICTLYSGSTGNAAFLKLAGVPFLVDAGKSARALCRALTAIGEDIEHIRAILLTHEHSDHTAALDVLLKHHPMPVHLPRASADKLALRAPDHVLSCLVPHPPCFSVEIEGVEVSSFPTPHDSEGSVGYRFSFTENDERHTVGYATDTGHLSGELLDGLCGCEAAVIECNHDIEMLREGPYPTELKRRILSRRGHLSNTDCATLAAHLAAHGTQHILLAHLSEQNNLPELAYNEVFATLAGLDISLAVASPVEPTWLCSEEPSC